MTRALPNVPFDAVWVLTMSERLERPTSSSDDARRDRLQGKAGAHGVGDSGVHGLGGRVLRSSGTLPPACVSVAVVGGPLAPIGDLVALAGSTIAVVRALFALVGCPVALVGKAVTFVRMAVTVIGSCFDFRERASERTRSCSRIRGKHPWSRCRGPFACGLRPGRVRQAGVRG